MGNIAKIFKKTVKKVKIMVLILIIGILTANLTALIITKSMEILMETQHKIPIKEHQSQE